MRINIYALLIIIEILDEIYARAQTWSTVEYSCVYTHVRFSNTVYVAVYTRVRTLPLMIYTLPVQGAVS